MVRIQSNRLALRRITLDDVPDFFELDSNPDVHRYLGNNPVRSLEQSQNMVEDVLRQYDANDFGRLAIILKATNQMVGWAGIKYEEKVREEFAYFDLGYRLKQQFWRKGIATEAAILSLKYGFAIRNLKKICAAAHEDNIGSNKILSNIGMSSEGHFFFENTKCNWYELSKERWEEQQLD